jgi:lipoprotein-anchoring transpeptidase ErfK/SrfK
MTRPLLVLIVCLLGADVVVAQSEAPGTPAQRGHGSGAAAEVAEPSATEPRAAEERRSAAEDAPIYYVVRERPQVFSKPDSSVALGRLGFREDVRVIDQRDDGWSRVLTDETVGWVASQALSNVWILIDKSSRDLYVYRGTEIVRTLPADVSQNPDEDKVRRAALGERGHYRIPEGEFYVCGKNNNSQYYRSLMLSYPAPEDAERGLEAGLISQAEYDAIVRAALRFQSPPMGTRLGGAIAIHGQGSGRKRAWTRGCIAIRDVHIDAIWDLVEIGTPVLIQ